MLPTKYIKIHNSNENKTLDAETASLKTFLLYNCFTHPNNPFHPNNSLIRAQQISYITLKYIIIHSSAQNVIIHISVLIVPDRITDKNVFVYLYCVLYKSKTCIQLCIRNIKGKNKKT